MQRPVIKFTSPVALLGIAVLAIGGIFALDKFYLSPYVEQQADNALKEEAEKSTTIIKTSLLSEQLSLERACETWLMVSRFSLSDDDKKITNFLAVERLYGAIVTDPQGGVLRCWPASLHGEIPEKIPQSDSPANRGVMMLNFGAVFFARQSFSTTVDEKPAELNFWLVKKLDKASLADIVHLTELDLDFVYNPPAGAKLKQTVDNFGYEELEDMGKLVIYWPALTPQGEPMGYFRAVLPVHQIRFQAVGARRMILITIALAIGLVAIVLVGTNIIFIGPVIRLLKRLQKINPDEQMPEDLTRGLHGESKIIAQKLLGAMKELAYISKTDQLTELANRRHFEEMMGIFYEQAVRYKRPLSLISLDVDFFKAVNDAGGHATGDDLLKLVARAIKKASRRADLPGRLGGDEFSILLPETNCEQAAAVARRVQKLVSSKPANVDGLELNVTLSIGIADLNSGVIHSREDLVNLADKALYASKERGRNCIVLASEITMPGQSDSDAGPRKGLLQKKLAGLNTQFKDLFISAVSEIVDMLEHRDQFMADHARKVQYYARLIAMEMSLPERLIQRIEISAMLHDIGMMLLPDSILLAPGNLDPAQQQQMQRHPLLGVQMMQGMEFLEQEIPAVRYHHERFDGKGYPDGLAGPAIPLTARILSVADCFDAMTSPRTFRKAMPPKEAVMEIQRAAGSQFDPAVIAAFTAVWSKMGERIIDVPELQSPKAIKEMLGSVVTVKPDKDVVHDKPVEQHS